MSGVVKTSALGHKNKKQAICLKKPRGDSLPYGFEEELLTKEFVTPDDVMRLTSVSRGESPYLLRSTLAHHVHLSIQLFKSNRTINLYPVICFLTDYLCGAEANVFDIDFTRFKIRDIGSGKVLFEITKPVPVAVPAPAPAVCAHGRDDVEDGIEEDMDSNAGRYVRYQFTPQFLRLKTVGAT